MFLDFGACAFSLVDHLTLKFSSYKNFLYNPVEGKEVCLTGLLKLFCLDGNDFLEGLSFAETDCFQRFKGPLSGLKQFLTTESPLKMMKNAFDFMLNALFVLS